MIHRSYLTIILIFILCSLIPAGVSEAGFFSNLKERIERNRHTPGTRVSLCYVVPAQAWLIFELPSYADRVKIITNANINTPSESDLELPVNYALTFEILGQNNTVIQSGTYHKHSRITRYTEPEGELYTDAHYFNSTAVPADGRVVVLDLTGSPMQQRLKLKFRLYEQDPRISDVVMRFYIPEKAPNHKVEHLWNRLSSAQKKDLARSNIYPESFLTPTEQTNLMRRIWQPLAPFGTDGKDYQSRRMLILRDPNPKHSATESIASPEQGRSFKQGFRLTLPIPEQGWHLLFQFRKSPAPISADPPKIRITWFGRKLKRNTWEVPWTEETTRYQQTVSGGLIELETDQPVTVRIFRLNQEKREEVTPNPMYARAYQMPPETSLTYRVHHVNNLNTPFRFLIRSRINATDIPKEILIRYFLLDNNGNIIRSGYERFSPKISPYDWMEEKEEIISLSEPFKCYFRLSPEVHAIRWIADQQILINAYNRPPLLIKTIRIPEDMFKDNEQESTEQATWFPVDPAQSNARFNLRYSRLLKIQHRPPEDNVSIRAGHFQWQSLSSKNADPGHYMLVPTSPTEYQRDQSLIALYREVPLNKTVMVGFKSRANLTSLVPQLIYLAEPSQPFTLKLRVDDMLFPIQDLMGITGRIALPTLRAGTRQIHLTAPETSRAFINMIPGQAPGYYLRFGYRLTDRPLIIDLDKQGDTDGNVSIITCFSEGTAPESRLNLVTEINGPSISENVPLSEFTHLKRRYSFAAAGNGPIIVLNTARSTLSSWQYGLLPLNADMGPGTYTIRITRENGPNAYLIPYRVIPGQSPENTFIREAKGEK